MSSSLNVYPSTYDYRRGFDPLLEMLEIARDRYDRNGVVNAYMGTHAEVCAVGAVWAVDGIDWSEVWREWCDEEWCDELAIRREEKSPQRYVCEKKLSDTAKEAIRLLDTATVELYPSFADHGVYLGPLEALNQECCEQYVNDNYPASTNRDKVLAVYDLVIGRLRARKEESEVPYEAESWGTPIEAEPEHEPVVPPELAKV